MSPIKMDHHDDDNDDNDNNDDNNDNNDNNDNRCNPFIIQKRTIALTNADPVYVFKKQIPLDIFYDFIERMGGPPVESSKIMHILKSGCKSNSNSVSVDLSNHLFYMVDSIAFKRGLYLNIVKPFMDLMASQYYRASHAFYAKRNMNGGATAFVHFIQVLRHISKHSGVKFISTTKYEQSVTSKVYYIEKRETQQYIIR
jgi:hypothetical protein